MEGVFSDTCDCSPSARATTLTTLHAKCAENRVSRSYLLIFGPLACKGFFQEAVDDIGTTPLTFHIPTTCKSENGSSVIFIRVLHYTCILSVQKT